MKLRFLTLIPIAFFISLTFISQTSASCGHCCMGISHSQKMIKSKPYSTTDSLKMSEFKKENSNTIDKISKIQEEIKKEYSATNPDFDKISNLKKEVIDHHIKLEKKATKQKVYNHYRCWCPMHHQ